MAETLSNGVIVDSSFALEKALSLRQAIEPPREVLDRLGIVDVTYYSFDDKLHQGQVVMDKDLLADVKGAFDLMTQTKFPVFSVIPSMDRSFMTDEQKAKTVNNSNGFSYRKVAGTDRLSNHSFGRAIDINPEINPYIKGEYSYGLDYDPTKPGTLTKDSVIVQYFKNRGWIWGGDWTDRKDYMHFEKPLEEQSNVFEVSPDLSIPKEEYYRKELAGITPDAFFVLGGGSRQITDSKGRKSYKTSPYKGKNWEGKPAQVDEEGNIRRKEQKPVSGGAKARPIAAAELGEYYPDATIVTMSHRPRHLFQLSEETIEPADFPAFAKVLDQDLQRLRVRNEIIENPASCSTFTEIIEIIKLCAEHQWQDVAVVTNDYQIERAQKFVDALKDDDKRMEIKNQLQFLFKSGEETDLFNEKWEELEQALGKFKENNVNVVFVSAENILRRRSHHYETLINRLIETDQYHNVVEQEGVGNESIDAGIYNFAQDSFREYILSLK